MTSRASTRLGVLSVDWAAGAEPPYVQAVANARLVALEIVLFFKQLKTRFRIEPGHIHIIGHGLGAHIAGYVGKLVPSIRRITALDPSGPYFQHMPPNVKLHHTDANYVEVIHTDCGWGGQGNKELTGHVDFYPNGGKRQPGCASEWTPFGITGVGRSDLKLGEIYPGCSHKRAFKYYIESLTRPICTFIGFACSSYEAYISGECINCGSENEFCAKLSPLSDAYHVNNSEGFYFITAAYSPFCVETLQVTLGILKGFQKWYKDVAGYFDVTIPQSGGDVTFKLNENGLMHALRAGFRHTFLVRRATPPVTRVPATRVMLRWHRTWLPCPWPGRELFVSNITLVKLTDKQNSPQVFCSKQPIVVLLPNVTEVFQACFSGLRDSRLAAGTTTATGKVLSSASASNIGL